MSLFAGSTRSRFESAAYTVLFLAFFFAVGLAGGVLYRVLPTHKAAESEVSPATASVTEMPAPSPVAPPPAAPAKIPAPIPSTHEAAIPPAPSPASIASPTPAPVATPAAPAAPAARSQAAESLAPVIKPAAPAERLARTAPPPKPPVTETTEPAKAAPAHAKTAEPAAKPKPAMVAKAEPPKPAAARHAPPPARSVKAEPDSGPFRVQFGAFAIEDNAHRIQWAVEATGMPVEIIRAPSRKGHMLYYVRSQPFPDREAALKAAVAARDKAKSFAQPVAIDYVVVSDTMIAAMQGETPKP